MYYHFEVQEVKKKIYVNIKYLVKLLQTYSGLGKINTTALEIEQCTLPGRQKYPRDVPAKYD